MRAILMAFIAAASIFGAGITQADAHGRGWGHGHYHGGWHGGAHRGWYGGGWNRSFYGGWNGGYRPYYAGYRGFYGYPAYRNYYAYRGFVSPGFGVSFGSYYSPAYNCSPFIGYPVYQNYCYPSFSYGCFGLNDAIVAPSFAYGATSLPPSYPTSELPYGFDGVRPFLDSLQVNNNPAPTTAASILRRWAASQPVNRQVAAAAPKADPSLFAAPVVNRPEFNPTVSPPLARQRAREMITIGDRYFREQKYYDASRKYREAAQTAPDLAEAHFRTGHALTAMNRYDQAAESFRKAVALKAATTRDGFQLDDLYGDAQIAKTSHIEALAAAAIEDTSRADHLLVLGMLLHYDGQPGLAEKCFRRSAELDRSLQGLTVYVANNEI